METSGDLELSTPPFVPPPIIWHRFTVHRDNKTVGLRVQQLTEDLYETAISLLTKYFMRDEPPCKYIGVKRYASAQANLIQLWRNALKDHLSVICVEDKSEGPLNIVGVNILTVTREDEKEEQFQTEDKVWATLFGAVEYVARSVDIFNKYDVDKFLNAYGLIVVEEWRGLNIGTEILRARIPLCKSLGIKVTATVFTAGASQAVAKKAGFVDLYEISYAELAEKGFVFPDIEEDTKSSKLMALVID